MVTPHRYSCNVNPSKHIGSYSIGFWWYSYIRLLWVPYLRWVDACSCLFYQSATLFPLLTHFPSSAPLWTLLTSFCCFGQSRAAAAFAAALTTLLMLLQSLCISSSSTNDEGHKRKTEKEIERCPLISPMLPYQGRTPEGAPWLRQKVSGTAWLWNREDSDKSGCTTHWKM